MDLDGLVRQGFLTNVGETFVVASAGVRWAIMLGAANAYKQGEKKDKGISISAKLSDVAEGVASVNDCCHDPDFRMLNKYNPAFRNNNSTWGFFE